MKILNICLNASFTENYTYQDNMLPEYQQKHGHDVTVVTTTRTRDENGYIIQVEAGEKVMNNGVRLVRIDAGSKWKQILGYYKEIPQIITENVPDLIFVHGLGTLVISQTINYKKNHPKTIIVADNHQDEFNTYIKGFPFSMQLKLFKLLWKKWIKMVARVYGTTSWRTEFAQKIYGIPEEKVDTLIMGVDSDKLPIDIENTRNRVRGEVGATEDAFIFVTGGKLDERKRVLEAMRAFSKLTEENVMFLLFGSIAEEIREEFYTLLEQDSRFRYLGYVESSQIHRYFYAADFGVFPGGHSVLWEEAIGCELPCLFASYGKKDHLDVCGNCVRLIECNEANIRVWLKQVLEDKKTYNELKERSREAAKSFSYHAIAKKSVECCEEIW